MCAGECAPVDRATGWVERPVRSGNHPPGVGRVGGLVEMAMRPGPMWVGAIVTDVTGDMIPTSAMLRADGDRGAEENIFRRRM